MITLKPYSSTLLAFGGFLLIAIGGYFIFIRPALLLEDMLYIGATLENVKQNIPGLTNWLQKVFWVLGGYIFTTGLLIVFISLTSFRKRLPGAFNTVALAGITSIGLMTFVNFIIRSDFKWLLFIFMLPWVIALILYKWKV